jgi:HD-GYP domain-containing protein (c-di-GMP phosphodiesterase class II)
MLQPGMRVGRPVYSGLGQLLINNGAVLTRKTIARVRMTGLPALYIDDGFLKDVAIVDVVSEEIRAQAKVQVRELLEDTAVSGSGRAIIRIEEMNKTVNGIIDQLFTNANVMVNMVDIRAIDDHTFSHSVNVCVLSLMTGITLGFDREKLLSLGIGALLHDIGKASIPQPILNKPGKLNPEEFDIVREHPVHGYRMLLGIPGVSIESADVAHEHHERHDGQGYPRGLKGGEIHEFAVICGVADVFDALTADRVYRKAYPVHEAHELVAGSGNFLFDYPIVEAFLKNIAAYPLGTAVRLSTGHTGIVVETKRGLSLYPRVRVLFDVRGKSVEPFEIALWENRNVVVAAVLNEQDSDLALFNEVSAVHKC